MTSFLSWLTSRASICLLLLLLLLLLLIGRNFSEAERDLVALPVRMGGLGLINPSDSADAEYSASIIIRVSAPLVSKIEAQSHETPEEAEVQRLTLDG